MVKSNVGKGSLVFVPKAPLSLWSKTGDPAFWNIGLVLNEEKDGFLIIYSAGNKIETIHLNHVRDVV